MHGHATSEMAFGNLDALFMGISDSLKASATYGGLGH
jgi:hypothetical protein